MRNARFTLRSDGTWKWYAEVSSSDTNDTWTIYWKFKDKNGNYLFSIPSSNNYEFHMSEDNQWYIWTWYGSGQLSYPASYYNRTNIISMYTSC
jgi:hypothetical protein